MSNFSELGLPQPIIDAITTMGFETPTPIQEKAIPQLLDQAEDLVGLAQTGTGKTAAFGLPLLSLIDDSSKSTQALVLAPTRELCVQISKQLEQFAANMRKVNIVSVYGGADIVRQIKQIKKGAQIICATPGRLKDLIKRKSVDITGIDYVVLDEADEMLNMGFKEELDDILQNTPDDKKTWLFSATMPREVRRIAAEYMTDPIEITVGAANTGNTNISHQFVKVRPSHRVEALKRFLDMNPDVFGLVFTRTRMDAKDVAEELMHHGYNADALHGDLNQSQRDRVMARFRSRHLKILVATDVAARGIDVQEITHVFHFNIPDDKSFYTHRAGRTGRAGNQGISMVLAHPKDMHLIGVLERKLDTRFEEKRIPTGKDVTKSLLLNFIQNLKNQKPGAELEEYLPSINQEFEEMSKEDIIAAISNITFSRFLKMYSNAQDINVGGRKERKDDSGMKRLVINMGGMEFESKGDFLGFICQNADISGSSVGRISLEHKKTVFDIDGALAAKIVETFDGASYDGRVVRVEEIPRSDRGGGDRRRGGGGDRRRGGGGGGYRGGNRRREGGRGGRDRDRGGRDRGGRSSRDRRR